MKFHKNNKYGFLLLITCFFFILSGCQKKNDSEYRNLVRSNAAVPTNASSADSPGTNKVLHSGLFTKISAVMEKYGFQSMNSFSALSFFGELATTQIICTEQEWKWNDVLSSFSNQNIFVNNSSFANHGTIYSGVDLDELNSQTPVIIAEIEDIPGYMFLAFSSNGKLFGYIKKSESEKTLFGIDYPTFISNSGKDNSPVWINQDISSELTQIISGKYLFAGGAGAWSNLLTLNTNGSFNGIYSEKTCKPDNTDIQINGICEYSGIINNSKKISEYIYSVQVNGPEYPKIGTEYTKDGIEHITLAPRGLTDCSELLVFLPGCSKADIPENAQISLSGPMDPNVLFEGGKLQTFAIFNANNGDGFVFWE